MREEGSGRHLAGQWPMQWCSLSSGHIQGCITPWCPKMHKLVHWCPQELGVWPWHNYSWRQTGSSCEKNSWIIFMWKRYFSEVAGSYRSIQKNGCNKFWSSTEISVTHAAADWCGCLPQISLMKLGKYTGQIKQFLSNLL